MTVERFINHVYYSYASVDRLLTYNPVSIEAREKYSRWDRYLGMTTAMTQVPVPSMAII